MFGLKNKKYPCENYPLIQKLNYDTLSFLEAKTFMHISKITKAIYSKKVQDVNRNIDSTTVFNVLIQIKMAIKRMRELIQQHSRGKTLTPFQMNSLELADSYLREVVLGNTLKKFGLTEHTANEIYDLMSCAHNLQYPPMSKCFWCKKNILFYAFHKHIYNVFFFLTNLTYYRFNVLSSSYGHEMRSIFYANKRSSVVQMFIL